MTPATLKRHYVALDKARTIARQAEAALKASVSVYAAQQGFLSTPRPETLRAQLGI